MSIKVAEGVVELTADARDVTSRIARDIDSNGAPVAAAGLGMGKRIFGGVLAGWAAIGGVGAVVNFFSGAVSGASNLNETMSASREIFGSAAGSIDKWGDTSARNLGLSKAAAVEAATGFGNMFTQLGWTSAAAADLSQKTVQVAADLGSFRNLPTADVSDRISAALRGEYDSLQALIPNINAARVEQEAMDATGKSNAKTLTAQEKAAAVLAIVQKDGAAAMGDFARTSDGAANKQKILTARLEDQQTKLGNQLLPAWSGLLDFLSGTVIPVFSDVVTWVGKNSDTVLMLTGVVAGTAIAYGVATVAGTAYKAYQVAAAATTGGLTVAQWALNAAMSANPIGIIIVLIGALIAAIIWVATQTTFFQDVWANLTTGLAIMWEWLWGEILEPIFTAIGEIFTWLYENVISPIVLGIQLYIGIWAAIFVWLWETILSPIFAAIGAVFNWLYTNVVTPVVNYIKLAIMGMGIIFEWLYKNVIKPVFDNVAKAFDWVWKNAINPVVKFISGAINKVGSTVRDIFGGIGKFIGDAFGKAVSLVKGPINGLIGLVNDAIRALNKLQVTIPEWVPGVGGQTWGLDIPTIPKLARGTNNAPDAFIAGEAGPELVTGARGATVRPYSVTQDLLMGRGAGGGDVYLAAGAVVIDAKNVKDFQDVVTIVKELPQVARQGRGSSRGN